MVVTNLVVEIKRPYVRERILEEIFSRLVVGDPVPIGLKLFISAGCKTNSSIKLRESQTLKRNQEYRRILERDEYRN